MSIKHWTLILFLFQQTGTFEKHFFTLLLADTCLMKNVSWDISVSVKIVKLCINQKSIEFKLKKPNISLALVGPGFEQLLISTFIIGFYFNRVSKDKLLMMTIPRLNQCFCLEYTLLKANLMIWKRKKTSLQFHGIIQIRKKLSQKSHPLWVRSYK